MPPLMQLPAAQIQNALVNFSPINEALESNRQNALATRKLDQGDTHMALEKRKVDMAGAQHEQQQQQFKMDQFGRMSQAISETKDPAMREQLVGMAQTKFPDLISHAVDKGADPNHPEFWPAMRWHASNYDPLGEKAKLAGIEHSRMGTALQSAQLQQVKTQTPEWREANAERFNIIKGTPEHTQFVLNGQYAPKADTFDLKDGERRFQQTRQPDGSYRVTPIAGADDGALKPVDRAKAEAEMRKEVTKYATDYTTIRDSHAQINAISKSPSAASDIAMVFSFMKILDPGSVVREGEYATAARAQGIPDRIVSIIEKIQSGKFLSPEQRQDFLKQAATIADSKRQFYQTKLQQYQGVAERTKIDPRNVILPEYPTGGSQSGPQPSAPPQGGPSGAGQGPPAPTYHNPETGKTIQWNGHGWVEVK